MKPLPVLPRIAANHLDLSRRRPAAQRQLEQSPHLVTGIAQCVTIIGIPLGLANFKLIPISLLPLGRKIVSVDQARAMGLSADAWL